MIAGELIAGKYRVEHTLGQGGMGVVMSAWHVHLRQRVAIKVLKEGLSQRPTVVERFLREARAASRIRSEHVVRVIDVDELESGAPYMVMEYLEGHDLAFLAQRDGPMSVERAVGCVLEACEALAEAHALGIVHRDIKPANLFLTLRRDGSTCTKVLDFGVSKLLGADEDLTQTDAGLGTPSYMAPEQMLSARAVDHRADIWALGVVLYKLVTGAVPFPASTPQELGMRVLTGSPTPPREARPDLPEAFEAVVLRCLQRDPASRFQSVTELAEALAPFGSPTTVDASAPLLSGLPSATESASPTTLTPEPLSLPSPPSRTLPTSPEAEPTPGAVKSSPRRPSRRAAILMTLLVAAPAAGAVLLGAERPSADPIAAETSTSSPPNRPVATSASARLETPTVAVDAGEDAQALTTSPDPPGPSPTPPDSSDRPRRTAHPPAPKSPSGKVPPPDEDPFGWKRK